MATVYSLVCWGGRTGKTVTLTDAGDIVNSSAHGLRDGTPLQFTSGTMPSGLALNTTYYSKSTGFNAFTLYTTDALTTQVTWTGSGTGPFVLKSKAAIDYLASPPTSERWGTAGAERCYDGLISWHAARIALSNGFTEEVCELGEAFTDKSTGVTQIALKSPSTKIISSINGVRTPAWHGGIYSALGTVGYVLLGNYGVGGGMSLKAANVEIDGFTIDAAGDSSPVVYFLGMNCTARKIIGRNSSARGFSLYSPGSKAVGCLAKGCGQGFFAVAFTSGVVVANCIATGNTTGFANDGSSSRGWYFNNISLGNTTNWGASTLSTDPLIAIASNNAGLAGEAWTTAEGVRITLATSDFFDYANNDFRPALSSSPQVDQGVAYYGVSTTDISDSEVPSYNNGGSEAYDIGCYEFDNGFGPHPAATTVTFQGVNAGSEIRVYDASANDLAGVESCTTDPVLTWNVAAGQQRIVIIHPDYRIKEFNYTNVAGPVTLPVQQEVDRWFSNP